MPGRPCSVCIHPHRATIDAALQNGQKQASIAREYKISPDALSRHFLSHLSGAGACITPDRTEAAAAPGGPLETLLSTQERLLRVIERAEHNRQPTTMIVACRELRQTLETIARLTGQTDSSGALRHHSQSGNGQITDVRERIAAKLAALADRPAQ